MRRAISRMVSRIAPLRVGPFAIARSFGPAAVALLAAAITEPTEALMCSPSASRSARPRSSSTYRCIHYCQGDAMKGSRAWLRDLRETPDSRKPGRVTFRVTGDWWSASSRPWDRNEKKYANTPLSEVLRGCGIQHCSCGARPRSDQ